MRDVLLYACYESTFSRMPVRAFCFMFAEKYGNVRKMAAAVFKDLLPGVDKVYKEFTVGCGYCGYMVL